MLKRILVLLGVLTVASVAVAQTAVDGSIYCSSTYDCSGEASGSHVMCSYPSNFSSNCASNAAFVPTTDARRTLFLDGHNSRRNTAALGQLGGVFSGKTATRMAEMTWDDELEMFAQKLLLECSLTHDKCRKSLRYNFPGQNTAFQCNTPTVTPEEAIQSSMQGWWDENQVITSIADNNNFSSIQARSQYDHFTQMAHDNAFKMGCATVSTDGGCYYVACDYAITNWDQDPVYAVGTTRSACQTQSSKYSGLCSQSEDYNGYTSSSGVSFFNNDNTVTDAVSTFLNNGRVLFGTAGGSSGATATTSATSTDTASTSSQSTTSAAASNASSSSGGNAGGNQGGSSTAAGNSGTAGGGSGTVGSGQNLGYLLICKNGSNCKQSSKTMKKSKSNSKSYSKSNLKSKKQTKQKKNKKKCKTGCSTNRVKRIKYQVFPARNTKR